eukprot:9399485-Pyramimonas_sp.AAC.1
MITPIPDDPHQYVSASGSIYPWIIPEVVFEEILDKKTDSRPGPDGIPYSAWEASGEIGASCLYAVYRELVDNQSLPPDFNDSAAAFLPKGNSQEGETITRSAEETRPLSLSNTDNKL